jgi:hypothetical protein
MHRCKDIVFKDGHSIAALDACMAHGPYRAGDPLTDDVIGVVER